MTHLTIPAWLGKVVRDPVWRHLKTLGYHLNDAYQTYFQNKVTNALTQLNGYADQVCTIFKTVFPGAETTASVKYCSQNFDVWVKASVPSGEHYYWGPILFPDLSESKLYHLMPRDLFDQVSNLHLRAVKLINAFHHPMETIPPNIRFAANKIQHYLAKVFKVSPKSVTFFIADHANTLSYAATVPLPYTVDGNSLFYTWTLGDALQPHISPTTLFFAFLRGHISEFELVLESQTQNRNLASTAQLLMNLYTQIHKGGEN